MTSEEQLAIRSYLAKAQGWTKPEPHWSIQQWRNSHGSYRGAEPPDPFTNADHLISLLEWARGQKWFQGLEIEGKSLELFRWNNIVFTEAGPLQEALPLAIYRALITWLGELETRRL